MSRNKIFIITGAIISVILVALLIMMQFIQGDASGLENSYTIEIQNCPAVSKNDNELMNELKAALQPSELKGQNGTFMSPRIKLNNLAAFGPPIYGMNFIRSGFDKSMYVLDDRKSDLNSFFESYAKSNKAFQDIIKQAKDSTGKEINGPFDFNNTTNEFIIAKGQADKKKTFNSLQDLRVQLDELINNGKITKGTTVKVYFICGDLSSLKDDDGDGVMDDRDDCLGEKGLKEFNGCIESKKDTIKIGGSGTGVQPIAPPITTKCPSNVSIGTIKRVNGMNKINWTISNITADCKVVVSIFTSNNGIVKTVTLPYNATSLDIALSELREKFPNNRTLACTASVEVYCNFKSLAKKLSSEFTLDCRS